MTKPEIWTMLRALTPSKAMTIRKALKLIDEGEDFPSQLNAGGPRVTRVEGRTALRRRWRCRPADGRLSLLSRLLGLEKMCRDWPVMEEGEPRMFQHPDARKAIDSIDHPARFSP
jgi:hypothetical protein